ncbi:MAG: phage holin family protein [Bacteriovoracaceae bacterium]
MENIEAEKNFSINRTERDTWRVQIERLYKDIYQLYEKESLLIRTEIKEIFSEAKKGFSSLLVGGVMLIVGMLCLAATAIIVLNLFMSLWVSALTVTAILLVVGGVMVANAKKKFVAERLTPRQSIDTFGEIKTTFKERLNEFKYQH